MTRSQVSAPSLSPRSFRVRTISRAFRDRLVAIPLESRCRCAARKISRSETVMIEPSLVMHRRYGQPFVQFRPPSSSRHVAHGDGDGLLLADDEALSSSNSGVEQ